jgi:2-succinyl-5-enolpyruvyl-6-hydroxy-3-cyclohexene-1-carboxylate synthase
MSHTSQKEMRLIFLHALPLDHRQWSELVNSFCIRGYAPRLYSFGDSLTDWAHGVLEIVGSRERLILIGNSIGGSCALEIARLAPDQVESLVLVETKAGHRPEPEFCDRFIAALERDPSTTVRRWVDELLWPLFPQDVRDRVHAIAQSQPVADLVRGVHAFHTRPDAADVAANWPNPLIWINGDADRVNIAFPELKQPRVGGGFSSTSGPRPIDQVYTVPNCGHFVNLEQPTIFRQILERLIASTLH